MKNKSSQTLTDSINQLSFQINQLKRNINKCQVSNRIYNKLLIERAVARKELCKLNKPKKSFIALIAEKFREKPKEKLISSYF